MYTPLKHIFAWLALLACTTYAAEETKYTYELNPQKSINRQNFETWDAMQAIRTLPRFPGHIHRSTYDRLIKAWNTKDKDRRWLTLHTMMFHDMAKGHNTDGNLYMMLNANRLWCNHFCNQEISYCWNHLLFTYEKHYPTLLQHQQNFLAMMTHWPHTNAALLLGITDAQRGVHPLAMRSKYSIIRHLPLAEEANRLWSNPENNANLIQQTGLKSSRTKLRYLLHDYGALFDTHNEKGLTCWHFTWGKDLPQPISLAMKLMQKRHQGLLPTAGDMQQIADAAAALSPEMKGFTVRSMLATDPSCTPWKKLTDASASPYEMPDCSAVLLPQWSDELLGNSTTLNEDIASFRTLVENEIKEKNFSSLLLFTLAEDALAQSDSTHAWIPSDGHFRSYASFDIEVSEDGIDVIIDEKGPRFSRDDQAMRQRYRALTIALHRCALKMAILDRDDKVEELGNAAAELGELLNKHRAWPLMLNQYAMRQLSPRTIVALTAQCRHNQTMLRAWINLVLKPRSAALHLAEHISTERDGYDRPVLDADTLAQLVYETLMIRNAIAPAEPQEKQNIIRKWMEYGKKYPKVATQRVILNYNNMSDDIFDPTLDPKQYRGPAAQLGYHMVSHALSRGDKETARRIFNTMAANPVHFRYMGTRLAAALMARAEGDAKAAEWHEKLAVSQAAIHYMLADPKSGYIEDALQSLIYAGKHQEAERLQVMFPRRARHFALEAIAPAYAAQGKYESACFNVESLLVVLNANAVSSGYRGSQAHLAQLRVEADTYRALSLLQQGRAREGRALLNSSLSFLKRFPELAKRLLPCLLQCDKLPQEERELWRTQLTAAFSSPTLRFAQAQKILRDTPTQDRAAVAEADHTARENRQDEASTSFHSELYTWHLALANENSQHSDEEDFEAHAGRRETHQTIKARILKAAYEHNDDAENKLWLQLESGRLLQVKFTEISTEDIENVIHWKESNNIHTWAYHPNMSGKPFDAKVERIVQSPKTSLKRTINHIPIVSFQEVYFITPTNTRFKVFPDLLDDESRAALASYRVQTNEETSYFDSLPAAELEATRRNVSIRVHMLGRKGGPEEAQFREIMKTDASAARYVHAVAYQDEHGQWDALGQEIMSILKDKRELCNTQDVPAQDFIYQNGFLVELNSTGIPKVWDYVYSAQFPGAQKKNALFAAIRNNNSAEVEEMLRAEPHLANMVCRDTTSTPLHVALLGHCPVGMVDLLLKHGSRITLRSTDATPMLVCALNSGRVKKVQLLLEKGANPNVVCHNIMRGNQYNYPLFYTHAKSELVKVLLDAGADPNLRDTQNRSPLYHFFDNKQTRSKVPEIAELMKNKGHDLNARDNEGNSLLRYICRSCAHLFMQKDTALHQECLTIIEKLIQLGADVQEQEDGKPTLLDYLKGKYQGAGTPAPQAVLDLLIKYGAKESE